MARKLKPNTADETGANKDHNIKDLNKLIRECAKQAVDIKIARKELNEQMGDIRTRLRESGVETKAFEFAVRLTELEQEARDNYLDWLKVSFEALGVGVQGSLFPDAKPEVEPEERPGPRVVK